MGGNYTIFDGEKEYLSIPRGKIKLDEKLVIGDFVEFSKQNDSEICVIEKFFQRENELERPRVANISRVVIILSLQPEPSFDLIDRMLCSLYAKGIDVVLCVNKLDILTSDFIEKVRENYRNSVNQIIVTSALTGENLEELETVIAEGLTCFAGQSAVGKSSILNRILGSNYSQVGGISERSGRGKHTTRHSQIFRYGKSGFIIDTPGFSLLDLDKVHPSEFATCFSEFEPYRGECRFLSCTHSVEPNCAVKKAVEQGELSKEKYERYLKLLEEVKNKWRRRYG